MTVSPINTLPIETLAPIFVQTGSIQNICCVQKSWKLDQVIPSLLTFAGRQFTTIEEENAVTTLIDQISQNVFISNIIYSYQNALREARFTPKTRIFKRLLKENSIALTILKIPTASIDKTLFKQIKNSSLKALEALATNPRIDITCRHNRLIQHASRFGYTKLVELALKNERVDLSANNYYAVKAAIRKNHNKIIKCLIADKRFDSDAVQIALEYACEIGSFEAASLLINQKLANPASRSFAALRKAAKKGHIEIITLLSRHPKVGFAAIPYLFKYHIPKKNLLEIIDTLSSIPDLDPSAGHNAALRSAVSMNKVSIIKRLLKHQKLDFIRGENVIEIACSVKHPNLLLIDLLLQDGRIDPTDNENHSIIMASLLGHEEVVERLMKDPRVNPADSENSAYKFAKEQGHTRVCQLLLTDKRVAAQLRKQKKQRLHKIKHCIS